jgi:hypothetical protein
VPILKYCGARLKIAGAVTKLIEQILRDDHIGRKRDQPCPPELRDIRHCTWTGKMVSRGLCTRKPDASSGCSNTPVSKTIVPKIDRYRRNTRQALPC